ncbi:MAG: glycosyltransferase family 2 protein [Oligoflexia bacterium]
MPKISVVTPCFNEEENVFEMCARIRALFESKLRDFDYEHIWIDNASTDRTVELIKQACSQDSRIKLIVNQRNFGHIRSPYYALLQAQGDAVICMASDFQDPVELLPKFVERWQQGYPVVKGVKTNSSETPAMFAIRNLYYRLIGKLSNIDLTKNFTGFGLYDKSVIETLRRINDPYPYFRGLIADLGFHSTQVEFHQPTRKRGITKNNFYTLYDMAMLGITNHSKVPLRVATLSGFILGLMSFAVALTYLVAKLIFWETFSFGTAPILIGIFFFSSVQLFFIGILGEYIGSIHTQVLNRPLVIEKERINFEPQASRAKEQALELQPHSTQ